MTQFFPTDQTPQAICVLTHGLNSNPERFVDLRQRLLKAGISVVMVTLDGHQQDYQAFEKVTSAGWLQNLREGFECALQMNPNCLPIHALGYSLGALLQLVYLTKYDDLRPDKLIYLAPGIVTHRYIDALKWIAFVAPSRYSIRSRSQPGYAAHQRLPMQAYPVLFRLQRELKLSPNKQLLNQDSLVVIDPKDELVSFTRILQFKAVNQLSNWKIQSLEIASEEKQNKYHHLIYDRPAMTAMQWELFITEICQHLLGNKIADKE